MMKKKMTTTMYTSAAAVLGRVAASAGSGVCWPVGSQKRHLSANDCSASSARARSQVGPMQSQRANVAQSKDATGCGDADYSGVPYDMWMESDSYVAT